MMEKPPVAIGAIDWQISMVWSVWGKTGLD